MSEAAQQDPSARLVSAYAHAVFFVDHTIQQLRQSGELIPLWAASRVVQDLVDLQRAMPLRFLQLARCKGASDDYWGFHAANVAVLAISFGARLGLPKSRRHDLGMVHLRSGFEFVLLRHQQLLAVESGLPKEVGRDRARRARRTGSVSQ